MRRHHEEVYTVSVSIGTPERNYHLAVVLEMAQIYIVQEDCMICDESFNNCNGKCSSFKEYSCKQSSSCSSIDSSNKMYHMDHGFTFSYDFLKDKVKIDGKESIVGI